MPHILIGSKKCSGCHMCEYVCSAYHEGAFRPSVARLRVDVDVLTSVVKPHVCLQTACAKCEAVCQENAIVRQVMSISPKGDYAGRERLGGDITGYVLLVDEEKCTNCGACYEACPQGVIHPHPEQRIATKCDLCAGEPQCIAYCQNPRILAIDIKLDKADKTLTGT